MTTLSRDELRRLVQRVFAPTPADRALAVLVDLPDAATADMPAWRARRELAAGWAEDLASMAADLGFPTSLVVYRNVRMNNADLPAQAWRARPRALPRSADELDVAAAERFDDLLAAHDILIAPTQFSTTAPLKLAAKRHGFRAATMPGFSTAMVPALRLDFDQVNRKVLQLKQMLDAAAAAAITFVADGVEHELTLDLRHRTGHASGGLLRERGTAGNLPSGEAYIVPYEGERPGDASRSAGVMPVELDHEVVLYEIEQNRARRVRPGGPVAAREAERLAQEPAYGNLAELGLGVLAELGVKPCGDILLDEKLGLHLAFGRSDHFGGQVGAKDFSRPEAVVHIDRVYVHEVQPRVVVKSFDLAREDGVRVPVLRDNRYVIELD